MYGSKTLYACLVDALHGANPQFEVGIYGVFNKHWHVYAFKTVGQGLHGKRVGRGARTYPQHVDAVFECQFHVLGGGNFCCYEHAGLFLYVLHPWKGGLAVAFKSSWFCAGLPYSSAEHVASALCELSCGGHNLLFCLCRTGSGNNYRAFVVAGEIERFEF